MGTIKEALRQQGVVILPPMPVFESVEMLKQDGVAPVSTILDPWYNKGTGGTIPQAEYDEFIHRCLDSISQISGIIYLWGFPEVIGPYVRFMEPPFRCTAWLTWYYKNCPSIIRGWRSSQQACIQFQHSESVLHPEHFLSEENLERFKAKKMRFVPGPGNVIETPLLCGFVGKKEQCGHPAQKPIKVFEPLIQMSSLPGEVVFDPMAGSGTTAAAALKCGRKTVVCDQNEEYIQMMEQRIGVRRLHL